MRKGCANVQGEAEASQRDQNAACKRDTVGAMFVAALVFLYVVSVAVEYTNRVMEWW